MQHLIDDGKKNDLSKDVKMLTEFEKIHNEAMNSLNYIISNLNNNSEFYEENFSNEYSSFEESLKSYCDKYASFYSNFMRVF